MSPFPSPSSSSTLIVSPDHHRLKGLPTSRKPDLKLDIASYLGGFGLDIDKRMSGKGFIEPHRNNLPRRKRRVVTAPADGTAIAHSIEKTFSQTLLPTSEAGPRSLTEESPLESRLQDNVVETTTTSVQIQTSGSSSSSSSSSLDTNITEPPSSLLKSPGLSNPSTTFPTFRTPKRALFHSHHLTDDATIQFSSPLITPSKGHLQPTCATLPRRNRSSVLSVAREQDQRRRSIAEQAAVRIQQPNDARNGRRIRRQSICAQELVKGVMLGFLTEGDENVVRIKVYHDSTPLSSSSSASTSSSELLLRLSLSPNSFSYTDGTTSLTDSQIQQACTFIEEHISIPEFSNDNTNTVLILAPRMRPEEAMSICVSYLAGMEKGNETQGDDGSDNHDDYAYSTVHRLLMAFHDDPVPNHDAKPDQEVDSTASEEQTSDLTLAMPGGWKGLRSEWRGVLSFDGMQRLDAVWTSSSGMVTCRDTDE